MQKKHNTLLINYYENGKNEQNIEIARNLLQSIIEISVIAKTTGLTEEEINKL